MIEIYRASHLTQAYLLQTVLENAGIRCELFNEHLQNALGEAPMGWMSAPRLLVHEDDAIEARQIVDEYLWRRETVTNEPASDILNCLACDTPMPEESHCPACGWTYEDAPPPTVPQRPPATEANPPGQAKSSDAPPPRYYRRLKWW